MSQPVVKYTLTKQGRQPDWLSTHADAFKGEHSTSANKAGKIPRYDSPQDTIYLGIASGDPDDGGTPDSYVGIITTKAALEAYISEVGHAAGYNVITSTLTGVQTSVTTGLSTAWDAIDSADGYQGGLTTTTSAKQTMTGIGTAVTLTGSLNTKIVTEVETDSGSTFSTVTNAIVVDPATSATVTGVTTAVGVTTTGSAEVGFTTTTTTTTTTSYSYTDVTTSTSTSKSETTTDGVTTRTDTVTTSEHTNYETSYDYPAEATRLWDKYQAVNA